MSNVTVILGFAITLSLVGGPPNGLSYLKILEIGQMTASPFEITRKIKVPDQI